MKIFLRLIVLLLLTVSANEYLLVETVFALEKKVFILHSYHQEYPWTKAENNGFTQELSQAFSAGIVSYSTEYLDTKRVKYSSSYEDFFFEYLKNKYRDFLPDIIFSTDDDALTFLLQNKAKLFADVPVIFCGVNNSNILNQLDRTNYTGVFEEKDIIPNLDLLKKIIPSPESIFFLGDDSTTYKAIEYKIKNDLKGYLLQQPYSFIASSSMEEILEQLKPYKSGIILLTTIGGIKDKNGAVVPIKHVIDLISSTGPYIIMSMEDGYLFKGVLGGYMTSGYSQGEEAAKLALQFFDNKPISEISLKKESPNQYIFNYSQLERSGLSLAQLPKQSTILNKPYSFYEQYKRRIWSFFGFVIFQAFVIILLLRNVSHKKRAEHALRKAQEDLARQVEERTAELSTANINLHREIRDHKQTEINLESHNQLMSTLLDNLQVGVFMVEAPSGRPLLANHKAKEILGRGIMDMADKSNLADVYQAFKSGTGALYPQEELPIVRGLHGETSSIDDMEVIHPDGNWVYLQVFGSPVRDKSGDIIASLVSFADITDSKLAESIILQEKRFTETALDSQQDTFFLFEPETGKAIRWNKAFREISGYSDEEIEKLKAPVSYYNSADLKRAKTFLENIFDLGVGTIELDLICKNGHKVPTEYKVSTIKDENGTPRYLLAIGRDLTERKELESRFHQLADNSLDWIWEFDENNVFTYSSSGVTNLLGYSPREIIGKLAFDLIPLSEKEHVAEAYKKLKESNEPFANLEKINQHKNGQLVTIESSGSPIFDSDGEFKGYRGIDRDITDRKRMEDELRQTHKMESIGVLSGGIAHDFNNILGIILGNAELALDDLPGWTPSHANIMEIKIACLRAKDVVRQLLSFSRKTERNQKPLDLTSIVSESIKLIRSSLPSNIEIREFISGKIGNILADATQIHQIIINLCTNAHHAMIDNGGVLEISVQSVTIGEDERDQFHMLPSGKYVELNVSDSGTGIAPENIEKVFDPYFTTKDIDKGTGMGLAVVHGIVKNHNGEIFVESEYGKGTSFILLFPEIDEAIEYLPESDKQERYPAGKETILLVDDETSIINITEKILKSLGYNVRATADPVEALEIFEKDRDSIDLVITDMTMPKMNGVQLSAKIKTLQPDIPIIICTGHSTLSEEEYIKAIGIAAYAMKPVTKKEIAKLIRDVLAGS